MLTTTDCPPQRHTGGCPRLVSVALVTHEAHRQPPTASARGRAGHSRETHRCPPRLVSGPLVARTSPSHRRLPTASGYRAGPRTEIHRRPPTASERRAGHSAPPRDGTGGYPRLVATALALALRRTDDRPRLVSAILVTQPLIIPPSHPSAPSRGTTRTTRPVAAPHACHAGIDQGLPATPTHRSVSRPCFLILPYSLRLPPQPPKSLSRNRAPSERLLYNGFASALVSVTAPTPSPEPPGGERLPATSGGRAGRRGPRAARVNQNWFHYNTA